MLVSQELGLLKHPHNSQVEFFMLVGVCMLLLNGLHLPMTITNGPHQPQHLSSLCIRGTSSSNPLRRSSLLPLLSS